MGSEYYFVSLVRMEKGEEKRMRLCPTELTDAQWVPLRSLDEWVKEHNVGLQAYILRYLHELYRSGTIHSTI